MKRATAFAILAAAMPLTACMAAGPAASPEQPASATFLSRLGQATRLGGRTITPVRVVEDSRCPANANCIQAGTVRLQLHVAEAGRTTSGGIGLGKPLQLGGQWLHLALVCPSRIAGESRPVSGYRFRFMLSDRMQPGPVRADCT